MFLHSTSFYCLQAICSRFTKKCINSIVFVYLFFQSHFYSRDELRFTSRVNTNQSVSSPMTPIPPGCCFLLQEERKMGGGVCCALSHTHTQTHTQMPIFSSSGCSGPAQRKTHDVSGSPAFLKPFKVTTPDCVSACCFLQTIFGQWNSLCYIMGWSETAVCPLPFSVPERSTWNIT